MNMYTHRHPIGLIGTAMVALCVWIAAATAFAQVLYAPPSSEPENLIVVDNVLYFSADDGIHGRELWKLTSTSTRRMPRLVRDLYPGPAGSVLPHFSSVGKLLLFRRDSGGVHQIWSSDGTEERTIDITPQKHPDFLRMQYFIGWPLERGRLFVADERESISGLWITDGTPEGTRPVVPRGSRPYNLGIVQPPTGTLNGEILFSGARHGSEPGLWITDGTEPGTREILQMYEAPLEMCEVAGGRMVFTGISKAEGHELWSTQGTADTTHLIDDYVPGAKSSAPGQMTRFHDVVLFAMTTPEFGRELWSSDGTKEGTRMVADIAPGGAGSDPYSLRASHQFVYFIATARNMGKEIWVTRGTSDSTQLLSDIYPGNVSSEPYALCLLNDTLFFSAKHPQYGEELWRSDGTPETTVMVGDLFPGARSSEPYASIEYGGLIFFTATHELYGRELWVASKSTASVKADINQDGAQNPSSYPHLFTATPKTLFFVADDIHHGTELWATDGTEAGTRLVRDIFKGAGSSSPRELTPMGNNVYFIADDGTHGVELWISDGTDAGTHMVRDICQSPTAAPYDLTVVGNKLFFVAQQEAWGYELWVLEEMDAYMVRDIVVGPESSNPADLKEWNGLLYFRAKDIEHGEELWVSDGTDRGTQMVSDIVSTPVDFGSGPQFVSFKDGLYFGNNNGAQGDEPWRLDKDGQPAMLKDIAQEYVPHEEPPN